MFAVICFNSSLVLLCVWNLNGSTSYEVFIHVDESDQAEAFIL